MLRNSVEDQNFNSDRQYLKAQTSRNSNKPAFFPTERNSRALSGKVNENIKQFDVMCFLLCIELERLSNINERLRTENQEIKDKSYDLKNYEYQVKDLSERLMKKEVQSQKLENQLADVNRMIAQKEMLIQNQYQQMTQQVQLVQQLQYSTKQLECKMGFLVCENENLNMKQTDEINSQQNYNTKLSQDYQELQKVYKSLLDNYNLQNEKLKQIDQKNAELERNNAELSRKYFQQEQENKNKMIQYADCKQKFTVLTTEIDRVNEHMKKLQSEQDQQVRKYENKIQLQCMRIILHCSEIDRLIEVQGRLMMENKQYRNQIELYALMMLEKSNNQSVYTICSQQGISDEKFWSKPVLQLP